MGPVVLTDAQCIEALQAVSQHDTTIDAAAALGISRGALNNRRRVARARGLDVDQAIKTAMDAIGTGMVPGMAWIKTDPKGNLSYSLRMSPAPEADNLLEKIRDAFEDIPAAPYIAKPEVVKARSVAFLPHADWHLGSVVSADHVGEDYNRDIAVERLKDGFSQCMGAIPPSETAIILNNGDLTHTNSDRDVTDRSNHKLKVEGTHHDNIRLAIHSTIWMIDYARQHHNHVIYTARPGNHDGMTPTFLTPALEQRYRDDPRVTIETDQRETWVWQRDRLFLSAHHGHGLKPEKFCANLPARFPRQFGVSDYWYFFTGHLHNRVEATHGGIVHRQLPAVCSIDGYGDGQGYADTSGMCALRFDTFEGVKNEYLVNL